MAKDVTWLTTIDEAAKQCGVGSNDVLTACVELNIAIVETKTDGAQGHRKLRPDDLVLLKQHFESKEE